MKIYVFEDWNTGDDVGFTTQEKRKDFFEQYVASMTKSVGEPPCEHEDYAMKEIQIDPDFNEWWKN